MDTVTDPQMEPPASEFQVWLTRAFLVLAILIVCILALRAAGEPASIEGVIVFDRQSRGHDDHFKFQDTGLPPVGGMHHNLFQNCGIYRSPIAPEKAVHSLEHGAIWITYDLDLPAADIAYLQEKIRGRDFLLLSPYPDQLSPVVITAWGVQLEVNSVKDERIDQFIAHYLLGPTTPERGATCEGGFGKPIL